MAPSADAVGLMTRLVVASFWVHRPEDFPDAADYIGMLKILDASCRRLGYDHVVLTDHASQHRLADEGLGYFAADLPRNLLQAATESHACWMASPLSEGVDTLFVGADCIILKDFRSMLEPADFTIILFEHKTLWIMTGFMHIPAASRDKLARAYRKVADDTQPLDARTCDDMMAWERYLKPKPATFGVHQRAGLNVNFVPEPIWNGRPTSEHAPFRKSLLLHFRGADSKPLFFDWARRYGFSL